MPADLGSARYSLTVDSQGLVTGLKAAEGQAQASSQRIAASLNQVERSSAAAVAQFKSIGATLATLTGFGAIASGTLIVHEAMVKVAASTVAAERATFSLNKVYGESAKQFADFSKAQAAATGLTATAFQQSTVRVAGLQRQYGLTSDQAQTLIKRAADLAAIHGKELPDAVGRVEAALRGEGEAAEALGLTLNSDAVKAMAAMTAEQRKNFETLSIQTKAQIIYTELLRQSTDAHGAAAEAAATDIGQISQLGTKITEAAAALGSTLLPTLGAVATHMNKGADATKQMFDALAKVADQRSAVEQTFAAHGEALIRMMGPIGAAVAGLIDLQKKLQDVGVLSKDAVTSATGGDSGVAFGPSTGDVKAIQAQIIAEEKDRQKIIADIRDAARKREVEAQKAAIDAQRKVEDAAFDERRTQLEAQRELELRALKDATDATVAAIRDEAEAQRQAADENIRALEVERDAKLRSINDGRDAALAAIDAERDALKASVDEAIRQYQIQRDAKIKAADDQRDAAIAALDAETRERGHARTLEDRSLQDQTQAARRTIDARHQAAVRGFEAEVKAANAAKDQIIRGLEEQARAVRASAAEQIKGLEAQARKAQEGHDARIRQIEQQLQKAQAAHDRALRRIAEQQEAAEIAHAALVRQIDEQQRAAEAAHEATIRNVRDAVDAAEDAHDAALRAIDEQRRAEDDRHRRVRDDLDDELRRREDAIDAELEGINALERAERAADARARLDDQLTGARTGLQRALSSGNASEIASAQREIAALERSLAQVSAEAARDAARDRLETAKDGIRDEIEARRDAEDEQNRLREEALAAEKRAADDRLKLVKDDADARTQAADDELVRIKATLDAQKRAADDRLKAVKDGLDQERQAADDNLKQAQDRAAKQKQAADDSLKQTLARIEARKQAVQEQAAKELESIAAQKQAAEDANKAALDEIAGRKQAEADAHDAAIIAAQEVAEEAKRAIQDRRTAEDEATADRKRAIQEEHDAAVEAIHDQYDSEANGIIPATRRAAEAARAELDARAEAARAAAEAAIRATNDIYNHPQTGLIPNAQRAAKAVQDEAADRVRAVTEAAEKERQAIQDRYQNASKTGSIDMIEKERAAAKAALDEQLLSIQNWAALSVTEVGKVTSAFDALVAAIGRANSAAASTPAAPPPPGPGSLPPGPGNKPPMKPDDSLPPMPYGSTEVTGPAGYRATNTGGFRNNAERIAFVRAEAVRRGHDPDVAERVARSEGAGPAGPVGDSGRSYGAFQAYTGGGQGNTFQQQTGLDPRDPNNEKALIRWQLNNLSQTGWEPFHGAAAVGVGNREGIGVATPREPAQTGNMVTFRDQWGNEFTQSEADFEQRGRISGGNPGITVLGRTTEQQALPPGAPGSGQALTDFRQTQREWSGDAAYARGVCGPRLAALFADAVGRPPTPEEAVALGESIGIFDRNNPIIKSASQFDEYATALIRQANPGSTASVQQTMGVSNFAAQNIAASSLAGGAALTGFNTKEHYFGATAFDPTSGRFNVGGTGLSAGGSEWMSVDEMTKLMGPLLGVLTLVDGAAQETGESLKTLGIESGAAAIETTDAFGSVTTSVTDAMGAVTTTVTDASGTITDQWTTVTTEVPAATEGMTGAVSTSVAQMGDTIQTVITDAAGNTTTTVTDLAGTVVEQFTALADGSTVAMSDLAEGTTTQATALADGVLTTVTDLAGTTITTFTDLTGQVVGQSVAMADGTITNTGRMAEGVTTTVTDMSGTVTETFTDLAGNVTETTTDLEGAVTTTFTDAAGNVTRTFTNLRSDVVATVGDMAGEVVDATTGMAEDMGTAAEDAGALIVDGIESASGDAVEAAQALGEDVTAGIAEGIESGGGDVADALAEVVEDAIEEAKDEAESASPSRKTRRVLGLPLSQGMALGIRDSSPEVGKALSDLVSLPDLDLSGAPFSTDRLFGELPQAMTMAGMGGGMAGASFGGSSVVIDLRGAQVYDGVRFEERLVTALSEAKGRGRLRFLRGDV